MLRHPPLPDVKRKLFYDAGVGETTAAEGAKTAGEVGAAEGTAAAGSTVAADAVTGEVAGTLVEGATATAATPAVGGSLASLGFTPGSAGGLAEALKTGATLLTAGSGAVSAYTAYQAKRMAKLGLQKPAMQESKQPDLDYAAIQKKNALLFGEDSPLDTDITKGKGGTGNIGRTVLLGGTDSLGA